MKMRPKPSDCPHCEYDRQFPGFEAGGWMQQDNNGPIVSCPWCNPDGKIERREMSHEEMRDEALGSIGWFG